MHWSPTDVLNLAEQDMQREPNGQIENDANDSRGNRVRKVLPNAIEARRFYSRMLRENRNPQIVGKQGQ